MNLGKPKSNKIKRYKYNSLKVHQAKCSGHFLEMLSLTKSTIFLSSWLRSEVVDYFFQPLIPDCEMWVVSGVQRFFCVKTSPFLHSFIHVVTSLLLMPGSLKKNLKLIRHWNPSFLLALFRNLETSRIKGLPCWFTCFQHVRSQGWRIR